MWRSLLRRGFLRERTSLLFSSFRGEDALATGTTSRACVLAGAGAFFSSTPASSDQLLRDSNRIEREKEASHFCLDATRSTITEEAASTSTQDLPLKKNSLISFRNFLLCYPECVSVDENGSRIFISDSCHNRILISDIDGKILDCIGGSSRGFEDGEFESAKLSCPAASHYFETTDCLYFVDSQNHALRRADLEKRLVETVHPSCVKRSSGAWNWILDKLGFAREVPVASPKFGSSAIKSPWHLIEVEDDNLLIIDHSFEMAWSIDIDDGSLRDAIKGSESIMDLCDDAIKERVSLLNDVYANCNLTVKKSKNALSLFSSIASFDKHVIFSDTGSQRVMKYNVESKSISCLRFSNFGVLGLPDWLICPIERVFISGLIEKSREHIHSVEVLPGRCDIRVSVDIPVGTKLLSPLDENCLWRQVRGSGSEISLQGQDQSSNPDKVGVAQQWYDELDNLAFTEDDDENAPNKSEQISENSVEQRKVHFDCAVKTSPGRCEVVVTAVLYLTIEKTCENLEEQKSIGARLLLDLLTTSQPMEIESFFEKCEDLRDLVFVFPVHLRIKLECRDHPVADTNNEIISTDSSININISL